MTACGRLGLAFAAVVSLAAGRAAAQPDVCVAVAGREHEAAARAARRSLGSPSVRIDVRDREDRAALASRCGKLVVAVGSEALRAAGETGRPMPLVHVMSSDPRSARAPGVLPDADPRRVLEMLQKMAPAARRIGVVYDPDHTGALVADGQAAARALGMELVALPVRSVGEAVRAFHRFERELRVDALWLLPDGTATVQETVYYALEIASFRRLAVIGLSRWYVASGALFALVPTPESQGAAAGELGQQVLRGSTPEGVIYARDLDLYVNERTAERLGLSLPRRLLEGAKQVLP